MTLRFRWAWKTKNFISAFSNFGIMNWYQIMLKSDIIQIFNEWQQVSFQNILVFYSINLHFNKLKFSYSMSRHTTSYHKTYRIVYFSIYVLRLKRFIFLPKLILPPNWNLKLALITKEDFITIFY